MTPVDGGDGKSQSLALLAGVPGPSQNAPACTCYLPTLQPAPPFSFAQQTFKYLKTAIRSHLDFLLLGFPAASSTAHIAQKRPQQGILSSSSQLGPIHRHPCSTVAPNVIWPLPSSLGPSSYYLSSRLGKVQDGNTYPSPQMLAPCCIWSAAPPNSNTLFYSFPPVPEDDITVFYTEPG